MKLTVKVSRLNWIVTALALCMATAAAQSPKNDGGEAKIDLSAKAAAKLSWLAIALALLLATIATQSPLY